MKLSAVAVLSVVLAAACGGSDRRVQNAPLNGDDTTLGVGDVLDVRVYGEEELTGTYRVAQDGSIDFPFIGRVAVAGLEPPTIADTIKDRLAHGYLRDPQVSIFVREYNSKRVSVVGAVAHPGNFPMTTGLTVVQAISLAGGFTSIASRDDTVVTRRVGGRLRRFPVHAEDVTEGNEDDFPLQAGDIIYVPERLF